MDFKAFQLDQAMYKGIEDLGYSVPTPIQAQVIPYFMEGRDVLAIADTGTGKTAAFAIPMLELIGRTDCKVDRLNHIEGLVLAPTRELAIQIGESLNKYGKYRGVQTGVVFGGVTPKRHIKVLKREPRILVATPGRLLDLVEKQCADLSHVNYFILDEADRMLDQGMKEDVHEIISLLPENRQNMLLSATMPKEVLTLVNSLLKNPVELKIKSSKKAKANIDEQVYYIQEPNKVEALINLLQDPKMTSVLVFVRTKKRADKVCKAINLANIRTKAIHGDKNQSERQKSLWLFRNQDIRVLVATDVAARGIDIDHISHVINLNVPSVAETYVHRIGRTGRAGRKGQAITFCDQQEVEFLNDIKRIHSGKFTVK